MELASGVHVGPYQILGKLGEGGMGEVYRARDTALDRNVALKVLPEAFLRDEERLARFAREARLLASLNHPGIAAIYGIEDSAGVRALVMELVDGEDLSVVIAALARSNRGLRWDEALPIARQIAEALEAAHEQGIVHRDLKPANVKVRPDGTVKVLDFGLAKAFGNEGPGAPADLVDSPTVTAHATEHGVLLGTAAYMSPEQARGKVVDKRADIWAFGAVLYEMLTGQRAFDGRGLTDVLAAVVRHEIDWSRLPADTPPVLRQLLARCLEPDVKQRLRDIGEARVAIAAIERGGGGVAEGSLAGATRRHGGRERLAWSIAALAVLAAGAIAVWSWTTAGGPGISSVPNDVTRLSVLPPTGLLMNPDSTNVAISPNGRMVAFVVGIGISTENQLWVRPLESSEARRIEGGDGAAQPFWSPDSQRIGFFASRKLKTVAASGGPAAIVCDAPFGRGATWNSSNVIVFAPDSSGPLFRVPAGGGTATPVTTIDATRQETGHRFPVFLPDGDRFLFAALPGKDGVFDIFSGALSDPRVRTMIGTMESAPVYAPAAGPGRGEPGWLLFTRQGVLVAQPFDAQALEIAGDPVLLGDEPAVAPGGAAYDAGTRVSVSTAGSLAYYLEPASNTNVQWMDATGKTMGPANVPPGRYTAVAIAPDARRAVLVRSDTPASSSMWLVDLTRPSAVPLTAGGGKTPNPVWSPDSTRIVYSSERDGQPGLFEKSVTDAPVERRILGGDHGFVSARSWSKEQGIVLNLIDPGSKWNIYRLEASGSAAPVPLVKGPAIEVGGWPSPDQRWLAYLSDEAGHLDLFVQSIPGGGHRTQLASGGIQLQQCWWTPDGRRILYMTRDQALWGVDVDLRGATPRVAAPVQLATFPGTLVAMDLAPDGRRFLALVRERAGLGTVSIVQSWRSAVAGR